MRKALTTLVFLLSSILVYGQSIDTLSNKIYAVQLFSTTMNPYPHVEEIYELTEKDNVFIEPKTVEGVIHYRYLVKCQSIQEANQEKLILMQLYEDAFIVYYNRNERYN